PSLDALSGTPTSQSPRGEERASWEGDWRDSWHGLHARRAPTMKLWSFDARNGDHTSCLAGYG
ncbi:MAG: hypothetical protein KGJ48_08840, partial [Nitrospirota bacterium]|nr:hypothetical protein [Nitrospirota bacterium]